MAGDSLIVPIDPGQGAGPVRLGMTEPEVLATMARPDSKQPDWLGVGETWFWHGAAFQVAFGGDGRVGDIQLCARGPLTCLVDGIDVLWTPADEVVARLSRLDPGGYTEEGFSYSFPQSRLGFWRQCLPGEAPNDDEQYRGGRFWDTVNTWTASYDAEIAAAVERRRGG